MVDVIQSSVYAGEEGTPFEDRWLNIQVSCPPDFSLIPPPTITFYGSADGEPARAWKFTYAGPADE